MRRVMMAVVVLPAALSAQRGTLPGWYIETQVVTRYEGEPAASLPPAKERTQRDWRAGGYSRSEGRFVVGDQGADTYVIGRARESRSYSVSPAARVVRVMDPKAMLKVTAAQPFTPKFDETPYVRVGDGGVLLGHRTTRYDRTISYTLPTVPGSTAPRTTTMRASYWIATDTTDPLIAAWLREVKHVTGDSADHRPRGLLLRSEVRASAARATQLTEQRVVVVRREPVDTMKFVVPTDYRRVDAVAELQKRQADLGARMKGMQLNLDEMRRLRASTNPADKAKLQRLMDSTLAALKAQQRNAPSLRTDPNAVRIDGGASKKPQAEQP